MVKKIFKSYEDAKACIKKLGLKGKNEYIEWAKTSQRPSDIPASPRNVYIKNGFSWGDFLSTGTKRPGSIKFLSYDDAKKYIHKLFF